MSRAARFGTEQNILTGTSWTVSLFGVATYEDPDFDIALDLAECLRKRASRGSRSSMLKFQCANSLTEGAVFALEEVVDKLEWDVYHNPSLPSPTDHGSNDPRANHSDSAASASPTPSPLIG